MDPNSRIGNLPIGKLEFPLVHPIMAMVNYDYDEKYSSEFFPLLTQNNTEVPKYRFRYLLQKLRKKIKIRIKSKQDQL